jgi:hypothetical protein
MSNRKHWSMVAALVILGATIATGAARSGHAQTMYPYIWGISNMGETCAGWCYGGPHAGQYLCCGVTTKPAPAPSPGS